MRLALLASSLVLVAGFAFAEGAKAPTPSGTALTTRLDLTHVKDADLRKDLAEFEAVDGKERFEFFLIEERRRESGVIVYDLTFPSGRPSAHAENNTVHCRFYQTPVKDGEKAPLAFVLHHLGGDFSAEALLAEFLAESGVHALEVEFPYYGPRRPKKGPAPKGLMQADFTAAVSAMRQAICDFRRALDWVESRNDVDMKRVGVTGVSLGGILGSIVSGVDQRFQRNVYIIAGGDLGGIIMNPSGETRRAREVIAKKGWSIDDVRQLVNPIEPLRYAHRIDGRGAMMITAGQDQIIPKASSDALWEAIGKPPRHFYPTDHYIVATFLLDLFQKVRDHYLAPPLV
ncbi:MAG: alpha/beta hydrolase family protein, partial [Planctomycetota bacterium]